MATTQPHRPWTEKYRPRHLRGVAFQANVVRVLQSTLTGRGAGGDASVAVRGANVPCLLFHGAPGTGKTSTAHALANELFPTPALFEERVLELNASDDRGVSVVRNAIKSFARQPVMPDASGKIPPFRLVILDEADAMTASAQAALRRMIEQYATYTRFCLLCNYLSGLLAPIVSRCAVFPFRSPTPNQMVRRLNAIALRERLLLGADDAEHAQVLREYAEHSDGDMRRALHWLQCLHGVWQTERDGSGATPAATTAAAAVNESLPLARCDAALARTVLGHMSARVPDALIATLADVMLAPTPQPYMSWHVKIIGRVLHEGYSVVACLQQLCSTLLERSASASGAANDDDDDDDYKQRAPRIDTSRVADYLERIADIDVALHEGADGRLQLLSLFHPIVVVAAPRLSSQAANDGDDDDDDATVHTRR